MSDGIYKVFKDLVKMDPTMAAALQRIRSGKSTPEDARIISRSMYTSQLVPKMGNRLAYNDFLKRHDNEGYHVHMDLNDFGEINKLHGEKAGDTAISRFGNIASEVSRKWGGKAFHNHGDEFKAWFNAPEHAHGFARDLRASLEKQPKVMGTHNLAASIGIGYHHDHSEAALAAAKNTLGKKPANGGRRINYHDAGQAPTVIHSLTHEAPPAGWKPGAGKPGEVKSTPNLASPGLKFGNPLAKADPATKLIPGEPPAHPALTGGHIGIMSGQNPMFPRSAEGENAGLEMELKRHGLRYEKIKGKYGKPENSFIIHEPSMAQMHDFGKRYGQESVVFSKGGKHMLMYTNGPNEGMFHPGEGIAHYATEPADFYSTIHHDGQNHHFSLGIDFSHLFPYRRPA